MASENSDSDRVLPTGKSISHFTTQKRIGQGGYGDIYSAINLQTNSLCAIKIEYLHADHKALEKEIQILLELQNSTFFPQILDSGECDDFRYIAMPLFGPSLSQMRRTLLHKRYTLYSIARLSIAMLNCIENLHNRGYVHCDVKPGNFLIRPNRRFPVCLIDFGLSRSYLDSRTGKHYEFREEVGFCGTCRYASIHAHREQRLSRRDDLISWMYSTIEMAQGNLPWPGLKNRSKTVELKEVMTAGELCRGLPHQFLTIWEIVRKLGFSETPKYGKLRVILKKVIEELQVIGEPKFDWETMDQERFSEIAYVSLVMEGEEQALGDDGEEARCVGCEVA